MTKTIKLRITGSEYLRWSFVRDMCNYLSNIDGYEFDIELGLNSIWIPDEPRTKQIPHSCDICNGDFMNERGLQIHQCRMHKTIKEKRQD